MPTALQSSVKNNKSFSVTGYLGGMGSYIAYTGTVTANIASVAGIPYSGNYSAYYGALAGFAAYYGPSTWDNPVFDAAGGAYLTTGLGVWAAQLNTTATETIAYSFTSPVPAGSSFLLVDPGASYPEYTGSFTFKISATFNGAAVSTAGWTFTLTSPTNGLTPGSTISVNAATGTVTVSAYSKTVWPDSVLVITPNAPVTGITVTAATIPYDFWSLALPHVPSALLLQNGNGPPAYSNTVFSWQLNGAAITGGGPIGSPGPSWTVVGTGQFTSDGATDILFRNQNGSLVYWAVSGTTILSGVAAGNPLGTWQVVGLGDFNGDGLSDILFEDLQGDLAVWLMNGGAILGGGQFGALSLGASYLGAGDFNADGYTDVLIQTAAGVLQEWQMKGAAIVKTVTLGAPQAGYVYAGIGDFNGDGRADILLKNPATGTYDAWLTASDGSFQIDVNLAAPGVGQALVAIGAYTASAASDLVFENTASGMLSMDVINAGVLTGAADIGAPGSAYWVTQTPYVLPPPPAPTIYFTNAARDLVFWNTPHAVISGSASIAGALSGVTFLAGGDFSGYRRPDFLVRDASGNFAVYETSGGVIVGGGTVGNPGSGWTYMGVGDFNGDGIQDILLQNGSGGYSNWLLNGANLIGGGADMGAPGAAYTLAGIADLNGNGTSDLIFKTSAGAYLAWFIANGAYAGSSVIGIPEPTWTLLGAADFNGDGKSDLLFKTATNKYTTWDFNGASIVGGGAITGPGAGWAYFALADLNSNGCASILFQNTTTGALLAYNMNDATVVSSVNIGAPGLSYTALTAI